MVSSPTKGSNEEGEAEPSNRVFVGCLSKYTTDESLYTLFGGLPGFVSSQVVEDRQTGHCKGYGFLVFSTVELAEECIKLMDGVELDGRFINVKWCISKGLPNGPVPQRRPPFEPRGQMEPSYRERPRHRDSDGTYAVRIIGLPSDTVWTELKDFLRTVGDIQFVRVHGDGTAIARFCSYQDGINAITTLNGTKFRGSRITIVADEDDCGRPAKRPMRDGPGYAPSSVSRGRPPPSYARDGYYPAENMPRRQEGPVPRYTQVEYADDVYPYKYEYDYYGDDGYYDVDYMYESGDVYEEYPSVYRGEGARVPARRPPASANRGVAYVRY